MRNVHRYQPVFKDSGKFIQLRNKHVPPSDRKQQQVYELNVVKTCLKQMANMLIWLRDSFTQFTSISGHKLRLDIDWLCRKIRRRNQNKNTCTSVTSLKRSPYQIWTSGRRSLNSPNILEFIPKFTTSSSQKSSKQIKIPVIRQLIHKTGRNFFSLSANLAFQTLLSAKIRCSAQLI